MDNIHIILGEYGKGKTRFLINYLKDNLHDESIALVSNSILNRFPKHRNNSPTFVFRSRRNSYGSSFASSIKAYFNQFIQGENIRDLYYILNFMGFKEEVVVRRRSLYRISTYQDSFSGEARRKLILSDYGKGLLNKSTFRVKEVEIKVNAGFEEVYSEIFNDSNLIDEPENSLHPKWQREYISFLRGFIGYKSVKIIMATHSPLIAMSDDNASFSLYEIENGNLYPTKHKEKDNNIEQVYYELFDILTPKNRYLSEYCNNLLKDYAERNISFAQAQDALISMNKASYDAKQSDFLSDVLLLLNKLRSKNRE
ncbi:hypothetical protein QU24_04610 [Pantoea rodasii]|uniref:ATPase AAA-type core domain-containing protein n=1 Tax=Pantoea rodasii TaxID=1076549 RepID=A0A0B1RDQ6_9GAMM|nr:AAA family ATPase [Pantoea rodasii]KHJ69215.1 hypothetical protein QU24_04610 [Pantoea rodasii]